MNSSIVAIEQGYQQINNDNNQANATNAMMKQQRRELFQRAQDHFYRNSIWYKLGMIFCNTFVFIMHSLVWLSVFDTLEVAFSATVAFFLLYGCLAYLALYLLCNMHSSSFCCDLTISFTSILLALVYSVTFVYLFISMIPLIPTMETFAILLSMILSFLLCVIVLVKHDFSFCGKNPIGEFVVGFLLTTFGCLFLTLYVWNYDDVYQYQIRKYRDIDEDDDKDTSVGHPLLFDCGACGDCDSE